MSANRTASKEHSSIAARDVRPLKNFDPKEYKDLAQIGICLDEAMVRKMQMTMDAIQATLLPGTIPTPVQFLQNWLPGLVYGITAARKIDDLIGIRVVGSWEDESVVQGILEPTGIAVPYSDYSNVPLSSWNLAWNISNVVRFEEGMQVGVLEEKRAARINVSSADQKRRSAALALDIQRNTIGFFGYNSGANQTYGFLNATGLSGYGTVPNGAAASPLWSSKTFLEICRDIRLAIVAIRTNSQDTIDPETVPMTLAVASNSVDWLSTTSDFGISVSDWLAKAYPNIRVVSAPQLNAANGGANVFYLFADNVPDSGTDGGAAFVQLVPTKFMVVGVEQRAKYYEEDYSNATAGVMAVRPYAIVRYSGI